MNYKNIAKYTLLSLPLASLLAIVGCAELNDPYGHSSYPSYPSYPSYGDHHNNYDRDRHWDRERHEDWERDRERDERHRLEEERERLEREREREHHAHEAAEHINRPPIHERQDHCPPGFSPRERSCSPEERKHGCHDIRLNSGMGCVHL